MRDNLIFLQKKYCGFVVEIFALIGHFQMNPGNLRYSFSPALARFVGLARYLGLSFGWLLPSLAVVLRNSNVLAIAGDQKLFQAEVDADRLIRVDIRVDNRHSVVHQAQGVPRQLPRTVLKGFEHV